jgi:hypothetical protein
MDTASPDLLCFKILVSSTVERTKVTPAHLRHTIPIMSNIVNGVIDTYSKRNEKEPDNMNYWDPKTEAYERASQLAVRLTFSFTFRWLSSTAVECCSKGSLSKYLRLRVVCTPG